MAAQEYYLGTQGAHELPGNHHQPDLFPSSPNPQPYQHQQAPAQPPPTYSPYPQPPQQGHGFAPEKAFYPHQHQDYSLQRPPYPEQLSQVMTAPYPQTPPAGYYPAAPPMPQQQRQNGYLGAPLQPFRSHSQPARVRFADEQSDRSTSLGSISDSDDSPPRHRHLRHRSHNRTREESDYSDRERSHARRHRPKKTHSHDKAHEDKHKSRDTFLGAGAGTIIGDAIFPGLGTAAGLVLGGYGGRKYAERTHSEEPRHGRHRGDSDPSSARRHGRRSHGGSRRAGDDGWDEKTATYRKGAAVR